ncbi:MAG: FAD-binding protein [Thermacetogeniaceae bacterium]|jgi:electron transfer flavoprotein alpha subunit
MLSINHKKCDLCGKCIEVCPFNAIKLDNDRIAVNEACKVCKVCIKNCPNLALKVTNDTKKQANKNEWKGILVFVEHMQGHIHPITFELIGKAKELASKINHPATCILIGYKVKEKAKELLEYGVDLVYVYDDKEFEYYRGDLYTNAFEDCIRRSKPSIVLVGATSVGRSLAPRIATRFRTGLTADCTFLDVKKNRPAFGGNIMAQIVTKNNRPQFATVRYRIMEKSHKEIDVSEMMPDKFINKLKFCSLSKSKMKSGIEVLSFVAKEKEVSISEAEVIVAGGRGIKDKKDLAMLEELAVLLGGQTAVTRPLVEAGWAPYTKQIGLSGRTVRPKLIITCGISGAVQFTSCMNSAQCIIAINKDKNAPIFETAHYGIVGDLYEIVPKLIKMIRKGRIMDAI